MVCYICNSLASMECGVCHRYVCAKHTKRSKFIDSLMCDNCANSIDDPVDAERRERNWKSALEIASWCDFCKGPADESNLWKSIAPSVSTHPYKGQLNHSCSICHKSFCKKHGQVVQREEIDHWAYWYRCVDHLKKPGILGVYYSRGFFEGIFWGSPDRDEHKG